MESFFEMCGEIGWSPYGKRIILLLSLVLVVMFIITGVIRFEKKFPFIKWNEGKKQPPS